MGIDVTVYAYTPFNEKLFDRAFLFKVAGELKQVLIDNGLNGEVNVEQSVSASTEDDCDEDCPG